MNKNEIATKTDSVLTTVQKYEITTIQQYTNAQALLQDIKSLQKAVDEYFDPAVKKAFEAHREILSAKKKQSEPLKSAENLLKSKIAEYNKELERQRRIVEEHLRKLEEERRLQEAVDTNDESVLDAPIIVPVVQETHRINGTTIVKNWTFRIVDEALIPREYLLVDEKKVRGVVRALKEKANIPGIEVYAEDVVRSHAS